MRKIVVGGLAALGIVAVGLGVTGAVSGHGVSVALGAESQKPQTLISPASSGRRTRILLLSDAGGKDARMQPVNLAMLEPPHIC